VWPVVALAQQPEPMRRIGVLVGLAENDPEMKERLAGFRQGLEKLGWSEGSNVRIDYRFAPGGTQVHLLARELVALQPDVILATVNTRDRCLETRDQYDSYRVRWRRRPNWIGFRCKLGTTKRQSDRLVAI
jgi:putative ABC transport system substrate-binding protein